MRHMQCNKIILCCKVCKLEWSFILVFLLEPNSTPLGFIWLSKGSGWCDKTFLEIIKFYIFVGVSLLCQTKFLLLAIIYHLKQETLFIFSSTEIKLPKNFPLSHNFYMRTCIKFMFANKIEAMYKGCT